MEGRRVARATTVGGITRLTDNGHTVVAILNQPPVLTHRQRRQWYELPDADTLTWPQIVALLMFILIVSGTIFGCFAIIVGLPSGETLSGESIIKELFNAHD